MIFRHSLRAFESFACANAEQFDPSRWTRGEGVCLIPFARPMSDERALEAAAGEQLAVSMAKAAFVQMRRMYEEVRFPTRVAAS